MQDGIQFLTATQLAKRYGVARATVVRLSQSGKIPRAVYFGSLARWRLKDIESWENAGGSKKWGDRRNESKEG